MKRQGSMLLFVFLLHSSSLLQMEAPHGQCASLHNVTLIFPFRYKRMTAIRRAHQGVRQQPSCNVRSL